MQNQMEQLNLKQEKLITEERNKTNRKLSFNKLKRYLENGEIITEFDKDAFEILVKQVIIGGYDEKDKADPKQVTFILKNESKINYEDYLHTSNDISQKNLQMSDHTCGVLCVARVKEKFVKWIYVVYAINFMMKNLSKENNLMIYYLRHKTRKSTKFRN